MPILSPEVQYYFYAENAQTGAFLPERAEHEFFKINITPPAPSAGELVINEILADNATGKTDPAGEIEDWVELYNNTSRELNLTGLFLSDNPTNPTKWPFPNGTVVPAKSYLIVWADEDGSQPGLHANFKLKASGEFALIATADGRVLDSISFGAQLTDRSFGRFPNGTGNFTALPPTLSAQNMPTSATNNLFGQEPNLRLSPNPARDWVRVSVDNNLPEAFLRLFDAQGRLVWSRRFLDFNTVEIQTAGLSSGLYFIAVYAGNGGAFGGRFLVD